MIKNLQGLLDQLEAIAPVFAADIRKDEVKENKSFFIYDDDGDIKKPDTSTNQYQQEFYLYFVTREKMDLDKFKIIEMCDDHRLLFNSCETQVGKIEGLDVEASMTTFTFIHIHRMCRG